MVNKRITALLSAVTLMSTMLVPIEVSYAEETVLSVGADKQYKTICEAVEAAKDLNPKDENSRVTINVDPGDYEEQVIFDNLKYITLQQTPDTEGQVNLHWYYCTGYAASNVDLTGSYNPTIDWTADSTWTGPDSTDSLTRYTLGQKIDAGTTITYYDLNGEKHSDTVSREMYLGDTGGLDKMAALIIRNKSENITVKDLHIVNSVPVMVTKGQKDAHLTPCENYPNLPERYSNALTVCTEDTPEIKPSADIYSSNGQVDITKYRKAVEEGTIFSAGESVWLSRSGVFNERGHAVSVYDGDKIIFDGISLRSGQDSLFASGGRIYFNNCNLIGGTDYIYGGATAVFNNCKLGFEGFSDRVYGSPLATPSTPANRKYGYLFFNCTIYNVRENAGISNFGGPWGSSGQATYYNTILDDNATIGESGLVIDPLGWRRFGAEEGKGRLYEYGTKNISGSPVDLSERIVNLSEEEGGTGMGTVLDQWQILEFNPRNYFTAENGGWSEDWDPMNFAQQYLLQVDTEINNTTINIPEGDDTVIDLPNPSDSNIEFHWVSTSTNAVVSDDKKTITVIRPAAGEEQIETSLMLYARDKTTGYGDKKEIPVTIAPTTNTTDVFDMPVTIEQSVNTENTYTVTVKKNGALIKEQEINVENGKNTASAVIENIPASVDGIDYEVEVVSKSNDFTVVVPEDGKTSVKGITGGEVELNVKSQKLEDKNITINKTTSAADGDQIYDIIALAKESGASEGITSSDIISIEFDVDVDDKMSAYSYIDISSATPSKTNGAVPERFSLIRINHSWHQLDAVDNAQAFTGTSSNEHQLLNITGKFEKIYPAQNHVKLTIDYKAKTVTIDGLDNGGTYKSTTPFTFASFPEQAEKGKLNIGIFVGNKNDKYIISNINVGYKDVVTDDPSPTENPTENPTEKPTVKPITTPDPTASPITEKMIVSAEKANGNTIVKLANITDGIVIGAEYENERFTAMKTTEIKDGTAIFEGFEADKVFVWDSLENMTPVCPAKTVVAVSSTMNPTEMPIQSSAPSSTNRPLDETVVIDFTTMTSVPVYSKEDGQGFISKSNAIMPAGYEREVAPTDKIAISSEGAKITESDGLYLHNKTNNDDGDDYNYGGLIYRIDTGAAGAYHLEVEITGTSSNTRVAPTGMDGSDLTKTSNWDNANMVPRTVSAVWSNNIWSYDFATGEDFIEIEIEPSTLPTASDPQTVGVKKITITPIEINKKENKPTIHILGDSTQKTYTFNETISSWGQTLGNYFDKSKVNVINYSMGGRAMKSNYTEGRFDEVLIRGRQGDFVFIHSAHNDETVSTNRFSRGAGSVKDDLAANNENYNRWLDMYVEAIKARGMIPVLVTAMPRTGSGRYSESDLKPNGFNPDSPGNMRAKAASDSSVGLVELYEGAKEYIDSLDPKEVNYIYNMIEAGETPANNSANGANSDGTHYRESAAKQWCRIMLQSIYDQSVASEDIYTDRDIMKELVSYMPQEVVDAAKTGDWSAVFPEMALDVSAVGVVPEAQKQAEENYYYRTSIEKALQLGLLHKDSSNLFKPTQTITVGEFARGIEKAFGLEENSLTSYNKTYAELSGLSSLSSAENEIFETVSLSNDSTVDESGEGTTAITVEQPEGGTVTVYNESAYHTATADMSGSENSLEQIADNDYFMITAPENIKGGTDKSGVFASNAEISTGYIETAMTSSIKDKYMVYTAKESGILTLYLRFVGNKVIACEDAESGQIKQIYINNEIEAGSSDNIYGTVTFDVEKGKTYKLYSQGGTSRIFGVQYASTDYPQSTSKLYAGEGDTIRVVAFANEGYVNDSIIINGSAVSTSKEYKFTLEGDTTVTASFTQEPSLVETTIVASDAALTREVMGAILYDAYQMADKTIMSQYMSQNGGVPSPDDPNYDPNIKYEGSPYIPLTGWGVLTDKEDLSDDLYAKVKAAYNLGLIRPETGIARGSIVLGTELEPKTEVTRAKAAKTLVFAFILTQPLNGESQTLPDGINHGAETAEIEVPNPDAPSSVLK